MLVTFRYDRQKAVDYARKWAMGRNPAYFDFDGLGGDCTNFISQCLYAGAPVMNYTPTYGWYYISLQNRSPAWSGVPYLHQFLVNNKSVGPFGEEADLSGLEPGDIIQLGRTETDWYHSLLVVTPSPTDPLVCAHEDNSLNRPLSTYHYNVRRGIHVQGYRRYQ